MASRNSGDRFYRRMESPCNWSQPPDQWTSGQEYEWARPKGHRARGGESWECAIAGNRPQKPRSAMDVKRGYTPSREACYSDLQPVFRRERVENLLHQR